MNLHNLNYSLHEEVICVKAITLFNLILNQYTFWISAIRRKEPTENFRASEGLSTDLATGGFVNATIAGIFTAKTVKELSLIHICRCRRYAVCRSRWSPYH
eukprot:TRINITY_DN14760_c0_g2_i3.p1 TRINITY_DN14760_c0_g2~~TRINITY_DN14760_c0_g2_i3.p1  ORF type:complete len:101 (-),score=17.33 TRINITY_DN14760_c0_g2_i3:15-317(-)